MGNGQSSANANVSSSLSFLSNKRANAKKTGQVVVVNSGTDDTICPEYDENLKRFKEIPRFLPILRSSLNQPSLRDPPDVLTKINAKSIVKFVYCIRDHLHYCATLVTTEQNNIASNVKNIDYAIVSLVNKLSDRKKRCDKLSTELCKTTELNSQLAGIQFILRDLVPSIETMNEILPEKDRLPPLDISRILDRTPVVSSSEPSPDRPTPVSETAPPLPSTPKTDLQATERNDTDINNFFYNEPIEELVVVDSVPTTN